MMMMLVMGRALRVQDTLPSDEAGSAWSMEWMSGRAHGFAFGYLTVMNVMCMKLCNALYEKNETTCSLSISPSPM